MALQPEKIKNKQFTTTFRGYKASEVEKFRSVVYNEYDKLYKINVEIVEKNKLLVNQLTRYKEIEDMLNRTLVVAQETADALKQNARNEAQHIVKEANINADRIVGNAIDRSQAVASELDNIKSQTKIYKAKLKIMLEEQIKILEAGEE